MSRTQVERACRTQRSFACPPVASAQLPASGAQGAPGVGHECRGVGNPSRTRNAVQAPLLLKALQTGRAQAVRGVAGPSLCARVLVRDGAPPAGPGDAHGPLRATVVPAPRTHDQGRRPIVQRRRNSPHQRRLQGEDIPQATQRVARSCGALAGPPDGAGAVCLSCPLQRVDRRVRARAGAGIPRSYLGCSPTRQVSRRSVACAAAQEWAISRMTRSVARQSPIAWWCCPA
jgi:hypothetical protein